MTEKIIAIEEDKGPFQKPFHRIMNLVPQRDRDDKKLQRLIAFRLKIDGEVFTSDYLARKIRETLQCGYSGSLYDFLKDDFQEKECGIYDKNSDPPEVA